MTNEARGDESTPARDGQSTSTDDGEPADGLDRRSLLKGTAAGGFAGTAFAGTASAGGWREITFCAAGDPTFSYEVSVTGRVKRGGTYESDDGDDIGHGYVKGACAEERCDSFLIDGELTDLQLDGPGKVFVDGELFEDTTRDREEDLPNSITIQAKGETVEYKFRVSGHVEKGRRADDGDRIDGNVVRGAVGGTGRDDFRYSGSLAFDRSDGPLKVTLHLDGD